MCRNCKEIVVKSKVAKIISVGLDVWMSIVSVNVEKRQF